MRRHPRLLVCATTVASVTLWGRWLSALPPVSPLRRPAVSTNHSAPNIAPLNESSPLPPLPEPAASLSSTQHRRLVKRAARRSLENEGETFHLVLPRNVPCLELEDVRDAHARCSSPQSSGQGTAEPTARERVLACARSVEERCADRTGALESRCEAAAQASMPLPPRLGWSSVVLGMAVHESDAEHRLLQAAADTWLQMTRGADLVLMTDGDDPRDAAAIAPSTDGSVTVHVYRCQDCRAQRCQAAVSGGGCTGVREGWLARRKVLHLFVAMARRFGVGSSGGGGSGGVRGRDGDDVAADDVDGSGGSSGHGRLAPVSFSNSSRPSPPPKQVFLKLDPDTVPVPHQLLRLLGELDGLVGYDRPDV